MWWLGYQVKGAVALCFEGVSVLLGMLYEFLIWRGCHWGEFAKADGDCDRQEDEGWGSSALSMIPQMHFVELVFEMYAGMTTRDCC